MKDKTNCPAVRQVMFPKDTNPSGNIFGGIILSHIDIAGAVAAKQLTAHRVVTVTMDAVLFKRPVLVGDILTCWTEIVKKGRTSIKVRILVEAERQGSIIHVTEGTATYVAVDEDHRPVPWDSPAGTKGVTDEDSAPKPAGGDPASDAPDKTGDSEADGDDCNICNHGPTPEPAADLAKKEKHRKDGASDEPAGEKKKKKNKKKKKGKKSRKKDQK